MHPQSPEGRLLAICLETLGLPPAELAVAKESVRRIAYFKWLDAGCPDNREVDFWLQAEREWIAYKYVPDRSGDIRRSG